MPIGVYKRPHWVQRFFDKVDQSGECWEWTGSKKPSGYGDLTIAKKRQVAHRVSWILHFGPIPRGMFVCHHCDNKLCVNPDHLFLGTHQDNMEDMKSKVRQPFMNGENHGMAKLTEEDVREIRELYGSGGISQRKLARMYGVHQRQINNIIHRKTWARVA